MDHKENVDSLTANGSTSKKNSINTLVDQWRVIDLDGRRNLLDSQAQEITDNKDANANHRKELAEQTKGFRRNTDEDKLKNFGSLLKAYQGEIDRLTRRCKFAENAYLSVYQLLAEAPDPVKVLTSLSEESQKSTKVSELELENRKLKTELEEFRKEFQEIKNQEVTIRRLEDQVREYEEKMEALISDRVKDNERQLSGDKQKLIDQLTQREQEARKAEMLLQEEVSRMQRSLDSTQSELFDLRSKFDERQASKQNEIDMLTDELERTRLRVAHLERDKERYQEQSLSNRNNDSLSHSLSSSDLELEMAQKDMEISQLKDRIYQLEQQISSDKNGSKKRVDQLESLLESERSRLKTLSDELQQRPTVQEVTELKSQLEIFKRALEYDEDGDPIDQRSTEKILKEKNKKYETELMQSKAFLKETEDKLRDATEKWMKSMESETELRQLVQKLEEDIAKGVYNNNSNNNNNNNINNSILTANAVMEEILLQPKVPVKSAPNLDESSSMLQIVSNQRDRFKARIRDLEQENKELHHNVQLRTSELESLRNDNIKLYEKIRYLQSYSAQNKNVVVDIENQRHRNDDLDSKYSQLYEESVNPFVLFNRKERYQRYKDLNAAEKVILSSGQFFLSTKFSRTFLFFYSVFLHLLVFLTTYKLATASSVKID